MVKERKYNDGLCQCILGRRIDLCAGADFDGKDEITTEYSERLIRLPLYYGLKDEDQNKVIENVLKFYGE